jgi:hypothetical protein
VAPELLVGHPAHDHRDVARALADAAGAAAGTRLEALDGDALVGVTGRDEQLLGVDGVVVLGVGHRGCQHLAHDLRGVTLAETQDLGGSLHVLATDQVEDHANLVRRDADVPGDGARSLALVGLDA